jgi:hypothetical protein
MRHTAIFLAFIVLPGLFHKVQAGQQPFDQNKFYVLAEKSIETDSLEIIWIQGKPLASYKDTAGRQRFFFTSSYFCQIKGYNGITDMGVIIDSEALVQKVNLISSQDTRSYVRLIQRQRYFDQYVGYSANKEIKTITGATVTSQAIKETIDCSLERVKKIFFLDKLSSKTENR